MNRFFEKIWLWVTLPYVYLVYRKDTKKFQEENSRSNGGRPEVNGADDKPVDVIADGDNNETESARPR